MFEALSVPFGAKMLVNTVKLKPGITMEDVELAIGGMCNVVKNTYGGEAGGFLGTSARTATKFSRIASPRSRRCARRARSLGTT